MDIDRRLSEIVSAENKLRTTVARLEEGALSEPSLCEGWSRGHVIAHIALNAHSVVNLFNWARTGKETPQYPSMEERAADIDRCAARTGSEHLAALDESGARFQEAARALSPEHWEVPVRGIGGSPTPAATFLFGRLREVEVHHVDLDAGYDSSDWPDDFVQEALEGVPARFAGRVEPFEVEVTDLGMTLAVGGGPPTTCVIGQGHDVFLWLLGRSSGTNLRAIEGAVPSLPSWG